MAFPGIYYLDTWKSWLNLEYKMTLLFCLKKRIHEKFQIRDSLFYEVNILLTIYFPSQEISLFNF